MLNKTKKFLNEIQLGTLNFIGSRPGIGKSTLALNFTKLIKENILLINLESSKETILDKLNLINYDNKNVLIETKCKEQNDLLKTITEYVNSKNVKLVIIDYIQLINTTDNCQSFISDLKELIKKLNIKIILFSQLPSEIDKRENKMPVLEDVKYNELYDNISFLYKDSNTLDSSYKKYFSLLNLNTNTNINYELDKTSKEIIEI